MSRRLSRYRQACAGAVACTLATASFAQEVLYHGTPIPILPGHFVVSGYDLNERGEVVGRAESPSRPFLWDTVQGTLINVGTLPGGSEAGTALGINTLGYVVGGSASANGSQAFLWDPNSGKMTGLGDLPGGGFTSNAAAINEFMQVVGTSQSGREQPEAFLWTLQGGMIGLGDLPGADFWSGAAGH